MTPIDEHLAWMMMHAVYYEPVHSVIRKRGKIYDMYADKRSHRKIISRAQLAHMTTEDFIVWLHGRSPIARQLFPDPSVYRKPV